MCVCLCVSVCVCLCVATRLLLTRVPRNPLCPNLDTCSHACACLLTREVGETLWCCYGDDTMFYVCYFPTLSLVPMCTCVCCSWGKGGKGRCDNVAMVTIPFLMCVASQPCLLFLCVCVCVCVCVWVRERVSERERENKINPLVRFPTLSYIPVCIINETWQCC